MSEYTAAEKLNKQSLQAVKDASKNTPEGKKYAKTFADSSAKWKVYNKIKNDEKVFGFKSFQLFLGELGPMFCFFFYAVFNLFRSFYFERKNTGLKILHGLIISGTMFYFFWIFQQFQDFPKILYYVMTIISAVIVVMAVGLITKYENHYINKLKGHIIRLSKFSIVHTKAEKKEELLDLMETIRNKK